MTIASATISHGCAVDATHFTVASRRGAEPPKRSAEVRSRLAKIGQRASCRLSAMNRRPKRAYAGGLGIAMIVIGVALCGLGVVNLIEAYGGRGGSDTFDYIYGWASA